MTAEYAQINIPDDAKVILDQRKRTAEHRAKRDFTWAEFLLEATS